VNKLITRLVFTALFAAIISAGAFIVIPFGPIPIVLQNMFTLLSGLVLGPLWGTAAVVLFLLAGAIGLPVFANNGSPMGLARILGPSGGYMLGYLLGACVAGFIAGTPKQGKKTPIWRIAVASAVGMLIVYVPAIPVLNIFFKWDWKKIWMAGFLPFIPGDAIKGVIAGLVAPRLRRAAANLLEQ
jgi:biotin transport system substrate-specific component